MSNLLNLIVANFRGKVREETLNGRKYLVAPVTMIKQGVLSGSNGSILYTNSKVNVDIQRWNNIPLVLNHPEDEDGNKISARSPSVLDKYNIGFVFNTTFNKSLQAEAWFDIKRMEDMAPEILTSVRKHKPVELSTGLYTKVVTSNGEYNGVAYNRKLESYEPDHLAILTDEVGACSLKDGCGVLAGNADAGTSKECGCKTTLSFEDIRSALETLLRPDSDTIRSNSDYHGKYITRLFTSHVIYIDKNSHYQQNYKVVSNKVELVGDPIEVAARTEYKPIKRTKDSFEFQTNAGTNCGIGPGGFQPGNKCSKGGGGGSTGGKSNRSNSKPTQSTSKSSRTPKAKPTKKLGKKATIQQAEKALAAKGHTLKMAPFNLKTMTAMYKVSDKSGKEKLMSASEVMKLANNSSLTANCNGDKTCGPCASKLKRKKKKSVMKRSFADVIDLS